MEMTEQEEKRKSEIVDSASWDCKRSSENIMKKVAEIRKILNCIEGSLSEVEKGDALYISFFPHWGSWTLVKESSELAYLVEEFNKNKKVIKALDYIENGNPPKG